MYLCIANLIIHTKTNSIMNVESTFTVFISDVEKHLVKVELKGMSRVVNLVGMLNPDKVEDIFVYNPAGTLIDIARKEVNNG